MDSNSELQDVLARLKVAATPTDNDKKVAGGLARWGAAAGVAMAGTGAMPRHIKSFEGPNNVAPKYIELHAYPQSHEDVDHYSWYDADVYDPNPNFDANTARKIIDIIGEIDPTLSNNVTEFKMDKDSVAYHLGDASLLPHELQWIVLMDRYEYPKEFYSSMTALPHSTHTSAIEMAKRGFIRGDTIITENQDGTYSLFGIEYPWHVENLSVEPYGCRFAVPVAPRSDFSMLLS